MGSHVPLYKQFLDLEVIIGEQSEQCLQLLETGLGGVAGADSICQSQAAQAGYANSDSYKALIATQDTYPANTWASA